MNLFPCSQLNIYRFKLCKEVKNLLEPSFFLINLPFAKSLVAQLALPGVSNEDIQGLNPPFPQLSNYQKRALWSLESTPRVLVEGIH